MMVFVLRHCAIALYHLFNLSLTQHYLPVEWRTHLIKPIFKSGDKGSIRNYSIASKVLEKIVYNNIVDFVTKSISANQFLGVVLLYNSYSYYL